MANKEEITVTKVDIQGEDVYFFRFNSVATDEVWERHLSDFLPSLNGPNLFAIVDNQESQGAMSFAGQQLMASKLKKFSVTKIRVAVVSPNSSYTGMMKLFNIACDNENFDGLADHFLEFSDAENWIIEQIHS